ncbi:MAG: acetyl-CoA carboxylase biotin carboxylase subunit [bacterium]
MFNKILIANRGEIAVRIIRACKEMGISTVAVYSEVDKNALHTQLADEKVCIGGNRSASSYLNMNNIISAACLTGANAIHPGFGFLSENAKFADMCRECKIKFIGPDAETIHLMGNKSNARKLMIKAKVPVIPGSDGLVKDLEEVKDFAKEYKYPIIIKASAGGGGRGIRIVREESELEEAYNSAKTEAKNAFGDDSLYVEKVIENARHIEIQVLADEHGNAIHLGERDCSLQRRNQKVLEEAPSVALDKKTREEMGEASLRAVKVSNYKNAGTIEFLYDKSNKFYFMEMNTRIQVEHPVTEMVTDIDIVKEQIRIAYGNKLKYKQEQVNFVGHSIECRINAEDPKNNFIPCAGKIDYLFLPSGGKGLRVDSGVYAGYVIPSFYDSMIAKVITRGKTRAEAIAKMKRALDEFVVDGISTNVEFQMEILENEKYIKGDFDTSFVQREILDKINK